MSVAAEQVVSAQVVLRSASGKAPNGNASITTRTIGDFAPSDQTATRAREGFSTAGFDVGPVVGISFSITAPVAVFEKVFGTRLRRSERGGIEVVRPNGSTTLELPLDRLPSLLVDVLYAVTFTPPPDFGPTQFGP